MFCHEEKGLPLSFDHFVGDGECRWRHSKAERLGGFLIDDQFELGWGLNWQVSGVGPFEDAIDIAGRTLEQIANIDSVGDQPTPLYHGTISIDGWHMVTSCQSDDLLVMSYRKNVRKQNHASTGFAYERSKSRFDLIVVMNK